MQDQETVINKKAQQQNRVRRAAEQDGKRKQESEVKGHRGIETEGEALSKTLTWNSEGTKLKEGGREREGQLTTLSLLWHDDVAWPCYLELKIT